MAAYGAWLAFLPLPPPRPDGPHARPGLRTVVHDADIVWAAVAALLVGALQQPFMAYLVAYAEQGRGCIR